uniref:Uncharacterized protein n=1 Tax=Erpetoichthys calabaricus TaxID=27687 RepID=A0A8C4TPZ8_ERPCA
MQLLVQTERPWCPPPHPMPHAKHLLSSISSVLSRVKWRLCIHSHGTSKFEKRLWLQMTAGIIRAILRPLQEILGLALIPELHVVYSEVELQSLFMS